MNPESRLVLRAVHASVSASILCCLFCLTLVEVTYNNMGCFYKSFGKLLVAFSLIFL